MATEVMAVTYNSWPVLQSNDEPTPNSLSRFQQPSTIRLSQDQPRRQDATTDLLSASRPPTSRKMLPQDRIPVPKPPPANQDYAPSSSRKSKPPPEDVCVECAMRDAEMADVDVTSRGVWDRESDVWYEELVRKEVEDERMGITPPPSRPRAKGHRLTEANLKLWLTMNPKESAARDNTVRTYVKAQIKLLEADSVARDQASKESRALDTHVRQTYSALRRSAYELSPTSPLVDDDGILVKPPRSASGSGFAELSGEDTTRRSKPATLLQNGLIVERVDLKEEERAKRNREKASSRQRANSRASAKDSVRTVPNAPSLRSISSARPTSVAASSIGAPPRSALPSVRSVSHSSTELAIPYDQASGKSPRFFNFKQWSGMSSRSSVALSGSMVDMHLGLEQDAYSGYPLPPLSATQSQNGAIDLSSNAPSLHDGEQWSTTVPLSQTVTNSSMTPSTTGKKKTRLGKIIKFFSHNNKNAPETGMPPTQRHSTAPTFSNTTYLGDDLTPPPPLSYLVDRPRTSPIPYSNRNYGSSLSLNSSSPRNNGSSPYNTTSSILSSPTSGRFTLQEEAERYPGYSAEDGFAPPFNPEGRTLHRVGSEPDVKSPNGNFTLRSRVSPPPPLPVIQSTPTPSIRAGHSPAPTRPPSIHQVDKDLPPLPPELVDQRSIDTVSPRWPPQGTEPFPQYDTLPAKRSTVVSPHDFEPPTRMFATEPRRQSFGGMVSRPDISGSTLEVPGNEPPYGDFGIARRSLNRLDDALKYPQPQSRGSTPPDSQTVRHKPPTKRRSRFGLSALLGRKSQDKGHSPMPSESMPHIEAVGFIAHPFETNPSQPRTSSSSRNGSGQIVEQDRNFIAYRYPSASEQLNLPVS